MSKPLGERLPAEVRRALDGRDLEGKIGPAYLLVSTDEDGTPRPCMLSAGEVLALDEGRIRVALWAGSRTSGNLRRGAPTLFYYLAPGAAVYVKGLPRPLGEPRGGLERFEISVGVVERDEHEGMPLSQGPAFRLDGPEPASILEWWRRQIESLRETV